MISMKDANVMKNGLSKNDPLRSWVVSAQERLLQEEEQAKEMKNGLSKKEPLRSWVVSA